MSEKDRIREDNLNKRLKLDSGEISLKSIRIARTLAYQNEFRKARYVALYAPVKNEVDTGELFNISKANGKITVYPKVIGDGMEFFIVNEIDELTKGRWNIPEPLSSCSPIAPEMIDLFVLPGLAFDMRGYRLGYGRGYYDRAICSLHAFLVGIAYDFQIVESINPAITDIRVDRVITDERIIDCKTEDGQRKLKINGG